MTFHIAPGWTRWILAQVGFNDGTETLETEEDPDSGPKRSAHGRKATAFVPKARAAGGVWSSTFHLFWWICCFQIQMDIRDLPLSFFWTMSWEDAFTKSPLDWKKWGQLWWWCWPDGSRTWRTNGPMDQWMEWGFIIMWEETAGRPCAKNPYQKTPLTEGDIPTRSAHGRKATAFVPNKVGVKTSDFHRYQLFDSGCGEKTPRSIFSDFCWLHL